MRGLSWKQTIRCVGVGMGLGLSISYSIVQGHGGEIHVENLNDGQGVRFTITLPITVQADAKDTQEMIA